jgi:phage-related protein
MLPEIIISITTTLIENLPAIIDAGIEILIALIDGIIDAIPMLIDMLPTIIEKIVTTIIKNLPKIIEAGKKILTSLVEGIIKLLSKLNEAGQKIITTIVNKLKELPGRMLEIGKNLVKGIWNGIKDATSWILDKIKGFGKSVLKGIKSIFGIHSPSTVMRDQVGKFLAQGIGVGFDDEIDSVFKDMQNALNTETNKIGSSVQISGASQSVQQMLTASASFDGIIPLQVDLDGEVIYDNQQKISARKNLQYGGVR